MHPELLNNSTFLRYYQQWQRNPESIVFAAIADYFLRYRMIDEAAEICQHGLKRFPQLISGRLVLAKIFIAQESWDEALSELHFVLSLQSEQQEALSLIAQVKQQLAELGPLETIVEAHEAMAQVATPQELSPEPEVGVPLQECEEFTSPIEEKPEPILPKRVTTAQEENRDDDGGIEILPSRWKTLTMAQILFAQGHHHKAKQIYLAILARDPHNQAAREALNNMTVIATS